MKISSTFYWSSICYIYIIYISLKLPWKVMRLNIMCFLGNCMVHFICVLCPRPFIISDGGDPVKEKISLIVLRDAPGSSQLMQASGNDWIEQERSSGFPGITDIMTPVFTANFDISMRLARAMKSPWNLHQVIFHHRVVAGRYHQIAWRTSPLRSNTWRTPDGTRGVWKCGLPKKSSWKHGDKLW